MLLSSFIEIEAFKKEEFAERLHRANYLLADTRIPWVSLYDHLILTSGIAAAFSEELLQRGKTPKEICGLSLSHAELRHLACLCGFLHDLGKARARETEYYFHVPRGVEYVKEWLAAKGIEKELQEVILGTIARHHVRYGPKTLLEKLVCLADSYASAGDRPEQSRAFAIKGYVYETQSLPEIRGASQNLVELEER